MTLIAAIFLTLVFAQAAAAQLVLDPPNGALPDVQAGISFSIPLTVSGGNPPSGEYVVDPLYSFIPAGLTVERTGPDSFVLTGTLTAAGDYDINIAIAEGLSDDDDFIDGIYTLKVLPPVPSIAAVSPNSGSVDGGTQVTITGTGFTANATVDIGGSPAVTVTFVSSTQIRAVTPPGAAGAADVLVTTDGGSVTEPGAFTYGVAPTIAALSPASGPAAGGTSVTITGTGFTAGTSVSIDGTQVAPTSFSSVQIRFTTPPRSPGEVAVVLTSGGIAATATFTYLQPPVLSPASGNLPDGQVGKPYRAEFTVTDGDGPFISLGFNGAPQGLYFDDITDTSFVLTGTPTTDGTFTVNVNARNNAGTAQGTFTMKILPPAPVITSVTPNKGSVYGGTVVTIEGDGFLTARRVFIGGSIATSQQVVSRWVIKAEIPPAQLNRTGTVDVWVDNFNGEESPITADTKFTYEAPPPVVDSVTPNSGPVAGGTVVTIRGSEFRSLDSWSVLFGDQRATNLRVISYTELQATSPAGSAGPVDVTVRAEGGVSAPSAGGIFTYVAPLAVTSVNPPSGMLDGGTAVTVTGTGFTGANAVSFGGTPAMSFDVDSDTQITAIAPARNGPGLVDVTVARPGATAQLANAFDYYVPLMLTPSAGELFQAVATEPYSVSFTASGGDGTYSFDTSDIPTELTASVQGGVLTLSGSFDDPQEFDFTIGVDSGTQTTTGEYSILVQPAKDAPAIVDVSPSRGSSVGGTPVTITGENFFAPMTVTFGGAPAANVRVVGDTTITATAPAGAIGPVDVTVTRAGKDGTFPDGFIYVAPPSVNAVAPNLGPISGGTEVTITGTGFNEAAAVNFGGTAASFNVDSDTQITATAPVVGNAGVVDIEVVTLFAASAASAASKFTYIGPPAIDAMVPALGSIAGGTVVTITGSGFTGTNAVSFGGTPAAGFTVVSDAQITATAPAGVAGTIDVAVTALAGTSGASTASRFTYVGLPAINAITPVSGSTSGGMAVTITGTGFMGASAVNFGGTNASFTVDSDTQITATTPAAGSAGTVDVEVTALGGLATLANGFTYVAPPAIDAITPALGPTGGSTVVTITGRGFTGTSAVSFGGTPAANVTVGSDTQITATSPAGTAGAVDVAVTTPSGTSAVSAASKFTYVGPINVYEVNPSGGPVAGGAAVTIRGTGFTGATSVSFGGIAATSYTIDSDTQITATTPARAPGAVGVSVSGVNGAAMLNGAYTYVPLPGVSTVNPNTGQAAGGTVVTITGTGFTGATAVSFGGTAAASFTFVSDTQIMATAPAGAGVIDVMVTTLGGTSAMGSASKFTYVGPPTVSAITPVSGATAGGTAVAITGTGFTGATSVSFGGIAATSYTVVSDTQITAISPAGGAGIVDVTVTASFGTSAAGAASKFTYVGLPTISAITPASGATAGGTAVAIAGTGFTGTTSVSFGGIAATSYTVDSDTQITATAPAGAAGTVDVGITGVGGTSTLTAAFTYLQLPGVSTVNPNTGPATGGTVVTISGTDFMAPVSVSFGNVEATNVTLVNATTITATTPEGAAGDVDVTVTSAGQVATLAGGFSYTPAAPVAADASGSMAFGNTSLAIDLTDKISGHSTSIAVATAPSHGTASVSGYVVTYAPEAGFQGTDSFTYTASGPGGTSAPATVTITVAAAVLEISPNSLPDPVAGSSYEQPLTASGGVAPYTFALSSGTELPVGLELSTGGLISGTPTVAGPANFVVQATDADGNSTTKAYSVTVSAPTLTLAPATLPGGTGGVAYQQAITATGGVEPYSYSVDGGSLPNGLVLSRAGVLSGVPSLVGIYSFTLKATDQLGFTATVSYDLEIAAPVIAITPASLPDAIGGAAYDQTLTASGGTGPYAFQVGGNPPGGIELSSSGVFSGAPTKAGTFNFTVIATDANGFVGSQAYSILVAPDLPVALSRSVTMMAGTTATVNLTEGATGGPFTGAAIVTAPPAGSGTASLSETELAFASHASASGPVAVGYTLSNRWGSSAPATITFVVQARPDPSKDPEVIGLIGAQIASADRLASGQIDNFRQRLEQVHDEASRQAASFDIRFGQTDSTPMNYAEEENKKDIFSPLGNANGGGNAVRNASNPPSKKEPGRLAFWTGGYVNFGSRDGNGIDLDHTMVGVSAGMDYRFTPNFVGGVGVGFGRDITDIGDNGTESRAQALSAAIYGSYSPRPSVFLDGLLGYSRLDFDSSRYVTDTGDFAAGNRSGDQIFGSLVLGYEHRSGKFLLSPYGGVEAAWSQLDRFSETGAGLYNLTYDRMAASTLAGIAGLRFEYSVPTEWGMLKPRGRVEYSHDFAGSANTRLGYADLPGLLPYSVDVDARSTDSISLELGIDTNIFSNGWLVGVDYRTAIGLTDSSSLNHTIGVKLGGKF